MNKKLALCQLTPALFATVLVVVVLSCSGCVTPHVNDVAPENQSGELFILNSGEALQKMDTARDAVLESAIQLYAAKKINTDDFATIISISEKYDVAYDAAVEALAKFASSFRSGKSVAESSVNGALGAVEKVLTELQGEI